MFAMIDSACDPCYHQITKYEGEIDMADAVLFTCVGTTDPVRGYRDGSMLHIMRHYRPKKVYVFLTEEMGKDEEKDHRYSKAIQYAQEHWENYDVAHTLVYSHVVNPQDLDVVAKPLYDCFDRILQENPESEILINLSSGTPQMKTILSMIAMDGSIRTIKGIQVASPEGKSGTTERTNKDDYAVEEELECNEDEEPSAPNRCTEPKLSSIERDRTRAQVRKLIEQRDYHALASFSTKLPASIQTLAKHLALRNDLQSKEAENLSREIEQNLGIDLYPHPGNFKDAKGKQYKELSEYYLLLRNLERTQRYSEFVLRLNPFVTEMLQYILQDCLPEHAKGVIVTFYDDENEQRAKFRGSVLQDALPDVAMKLEQKLGKKLDERDFNRDFSMWIGVPLLCIVGFNKVPDFVLETLIACERLNNKRRNRLAHQLHAITEKDIEKFCIDSQGKHYKPHELCHSLGKMLAYAYPEYCDEKLFKIYDTCNAYMIERL